jgi:hypothetical protein
MRHDELKPIGSLWFHDPVGDPFRVTRIIYRVVGYEVDALQQLPDTIRHAAEREPLEGVRYLGELLEVIDFKRIAGAGIDGVGKLASLPVCVGRHRWFGTWHAVDFDPLLPHVVREILEDM